VKEIIQIVPYLPPSVSGVGDYALLLAEELRHQHSIYTKFIVGGTEWDGPQETNGFPYARIPERKAIYLANILNEQSGGLLPVLLHYVGYGYEKRGCASPKQRLVTFFHELYALGPPWRSSFWVSPLQQGLAVKLARTSDVCMTNMQRSAHYLRPQLSCRSWDVIVLPVFSNVGELKTKETQRQPELVVFGGTSWRELAYTQYKKDLIDICKILNIVRLHDIGPPLGDRPELPIEITLHGLLHAPEIDKIMRTSLAGFFTYPVSFLGKSGIFAAYAAHGLTPVTFDGNDKFSEDGLEEGTHFLSRNSLYQNRSIVRVVGEAVRSWYLEHNLAAQAREFAAALMMPKLVT
jgi:hypothetical protein